MRKLLLVIPFLISGCAGKQLPEEVEVKFLVRAESGDLYA